jgi:hypothetical protein
VHPPELRLVELVALGKPLEAAEARSGHVLALHDDDRRQKRSASAVLLPGDLAEELADELSVVRVLVIPLEPNLLARSVYVIVARRVATSTSAARTRIKSFLP